MVVPKELKAETHTDTCEPIFKTTLSTIVKKVKQSKRPSTDEWINRMWYIHAREHNLALSEEILTYVATWMNSENINAK